MAVAAISPPSLSGLESAFAAQGGTSAPVAIAGGGLGGLVTAYRLMRAGIPCEIYEAAARTGGRVFTRRNFNTEGHVLRTGRGAERYRA